MICKKDVIDLIASYLVDLKNVNKNIPVETKLHQTMYFMVDIDNNEIKPHTIYSKYLDDFSTIKQVYKEGSEYLVKIDFTFDISDDFNVKLASELINNLNFNFDMRSYLSNIYKCQKFMNKKLDKTEAEVYENLYNLFFGF